MMGQANHFVHYAPEKIPYAAERTSKTSGFNVGILIVYRLCQ